MGRTLGDKIKVDSIKSKHDLKSAIEGLICAFQENPQKVASIFQNRIQPILRDYENECPADGWYFGYFSIMDFVVYEILNLVASVFPTAVDNSPKLQALRERFYAIPEVTAYEESKRAVKEYSPVTYF